MFVIDKPKRPEPRGVALNYSDSRRESPTWDASNRCLEARASIDAELDWLQASEASLVRPIRRSLIKQICSSSCEK